MGPPRRPWLTRRNHVPWPCLTGAGAGKLALRLPESVTGRPEPGGRGDRARGDHRPSRREPQDGSADAPFARSGPTLAMPRSGPMPGPGEPWVHRVRVNDRGASNSGRIRAARSDSSSSNPMTESPPGVSRCTVLIRCPRPRSRGRPPTTARRSERRSSRGARRPSAGRCRERARADPSPRDPDLGSDGDQARGRARA
jgi:hypothetical protein